MVGVRAGQGLFEVIAELGEVQRSHGSPFVKIPGT
jgi:hypothetical protein